MAVRVPEANCVVIGGRHNEGAVRRIRNRPHCAGVTLHWFVYQVTPLGLPHGDVAVKAAGYEEPVIRRERQEPRRTIEIADSRHIYAPSSPNLRVRSYDGGIVLLPLDFARRSRATLGNYALPLMRE